jgi:RNA polymerase sigma-70 factor (ECF subfamily)
MANPSVNEFQATEQHSLLQRALSGDRSSLGTLLQANHELLIRFAREQLAPDLVPKGSASDLVQETYIDVLRDFAEFQGDLSQFQGWLKHILSNNIHDFGRHFRLCHKRELHREQTLSDPSLVGLTHAQPSPVELLTRAEELQKLESALEQLSAQEQQLIRWRFRDRLSYSEIGRRLRCTEEAARQRVNRAERRWRQLLGNLHVA